MLGASSHALVPSSAEEGSKDFFFEKRSKKLLTANIGALGGVRLVRLQEIKVFWSFFSKKDDLPSLMSALRRALALPSLRLL